MKYNIFKVYLVTDEDYSALAAKAGVPGNYTQLELCQTGFASDEVIHQIIQGCNDLFQQSTVDSWVYIKDGHGHCFVKVPAACNADVQKQIEEYSNQLIAACNYGLQDTNPPHSIGSSSWAIIFQNKPKA